MVTCPVTDGSLALVEAHLPASTLVAGMAPMAPRLGGPEIDRSGPVKPLPGCKREHDLALEVAEQGVDRSPVRIAATPRCGQVGLDPAEGCRPHLMPMLTPRRPCRCRTLTKTLTAITPYFKGRVLAFYRSMTDRVAPLNTERRFWLSEAIFQVENDLEHRQPQHPQVQVLRMVRNRLYDDLGLNEPLPTPRIQESRHAR